MKIHAPRWLCLILAAGLCVGAPVAMATESNLTGVGVQPTDREQQAQYLEDFVHYVLIARPELAEAVLQRLFDTGISNADLYTLVDEYEVNRKGRLDDAMIRSAGMPELEEIAGELSVRLRRGRIDLARDPAEIERHIENLMGSQRAKMLAREALRAAGEYAVPQLLERLESPQARFDLKREVEELLIAIGREAVTPLSVALPGVQPTTQERLARILGLIGYAHALPALYELSQDQRTPAGVREAVERAYAQIGGQPGVTVAELWLALGEQYWVEAPSLIANPNEPTNVVWDYRRGLVATPIATSIFSEVMAMRSSRKALEADRRSDAALSLWIASNFRRSDQLGEDETDPTYGSEMRAPIFYAVASGPEISQLILARANNDMNSRLARHAINALHRTAGGSSLWMSFDRPTPLVDSLSFPERRVRYDAALALGQALPLESFPGSDRVVPILASAIRTGAETFAAVIADNEENRRSLAANLRSMGFTVLPPRGRYEEARADLARTEGLDLFVLMTSPSQLLETVSRVRSDLRLSATPVLAVVSGPELNTVRDMFESDQRLQVIRAGVSEEQMANSILALIRETTGELMTEEEADQYAAESLQTLRDIAVRNTPAFHITDAEAALLDALDEFEGDLRLVAAETLSWIGTADSQQKLLDAALNETDELTQAALLDYVSDSAKRFGAYVEDRQVSRLLELVREGSGVAATAAAQAHGALNLPVSNVTPFIIGESSSP